MQRLASHNVNEYFAITTKLSTLLLLLLILSLIGFGCGKNGDGGGSGSGNGNGSGNGSANNPTATAHDKKLETRFASNCINQRDIIKKEVWGIQKKPDRVRFAKTTFNDQNCLTPLVNLEYYATYDIQEDVVDVNGANRVTLTIEKTIITPLAKVTVDKFNNEKYCNFRDWQLDVEKNVTGLNCARNKYPNRGDKHYQISKIDENQLLMGDLSTGDGSSEAARPNKLNNEIVYYQTENSDANDNSGNGNNNNNNSSNNSANGTTTPGNGSNPSTCEIFGKWFSPHMGGRFFEFFKNNTYDFWWDKYEGSKTRGSYSVKKTTLYLDGESNPAFERITFSANCSKLELCVSVAPLDCHEPYTRR